MFNLSQTQIAIFGAGGLLGRHLVQEYEAAGISIRACRHEDLDVTDREAVSRMLDEVRPRVVINCAALCHFQRCEDEPALSEKVNLQAPISLAGLTAQRGIRLVQFSSDYIFDGRSAVPYREEDQPAPLSVYGRHKAGVEAAFREYPGHLVLRVAWLFGLEGFTFLSLLPNLLMTQETVRVAAGKTGTCLHVGEAARMIRKLIGQETRGLFNLVHTGEMSWEGFAAECLHQLRERGLEPACRHLIEVPLEEMSVLQGSRPVHSPLDLQKLTTELGAAPVVWQEGLSQYLNQLYGASATGYPAWPGLKTGPPPEIDPSPAPNLYLPTRV